MDVLIFKCHKIISFTLHLLNVVGKILLNYGKLVL